MCDPYYLFSDNVNVASMDTEKGTEAVKAYFHQWDLQVNLARCQKFTSWKGDQASETEVFNKGFVYAKYLGVTISRYRKPSRQFTSAANKTRQEPFRHRTTKPCEER